jgi:DNA-binding XRE family transcriptional regulator
MREEQRAIARRRLDKELRYYRLAAKDKKPTDNLLRTVRQVMGIRISDMARELGVNRSVIFRMEQGEERGSISMNNVVRVASAMGCHLVYAIVPSNGETLEHMADRRLWEKLLAKKGL